MSNYIRGGSIKNPANVALANPRFGDYRTQSQSFNLTRSMLKYSAIFLLTAVLATHAAAQSPFTARALHSLCSPDTTEAKSDRDAAETNCGTYILGLTDGMFMMQLLASHSMASCMPKEAAIDVVKARQIFSEYLETHPQADNNSAGLVVGMALADAYKCKGN